jgi:hypothetical protein
VLQVFIENCESAERLNNVTLRTLFIRDWLKKKEHVKHARFSGSEVAEIVYEMKENVFFGVLIVELAQLGSSNYAQLLQSKSVNEHIKQFFYYFFKAGHVKIRLNEYIINAVPYMAPNKLKR